MITTLSGNMQNAFAFTVSCNPFTVVVGKMIFTLWTRKFRLEEVKFLVQGHTNGERQSQGSQIHVSKTDSEACAFKPIY